MSMHMYTHTIIINYQSHINAGSHLVAGVKHTVTKLNLQYSASCVISFYQNSSQAEISTQDTIQDNKVCILHNGKSQF